MEKNPQDNERNILDKACDFMGMVALKFYIVRYKLGLASVDSADEDSEAIEPPHFKIFGITKKDRQDLLVLNRDIFQLEDLTSEDPVNKVSWDIEESEFSEPTAKLYDQDEQEDQEKGRYSLLHKVRLTKEDKIDIRMLNNIDDFDINDWEDAVNNRGIFRKE